MRKKGRKSQGASEQKPGERKTPIRDALLEVLSKNPKLREELQHRIKQEARTEMEKLIRAALVPVLDENKKLALRMGLPLILTIEITQDPVGRPREKKDQ